MITALKIEQTDLLNCMRLTYSRKEPSTTINDDRCGELIAITSEFLSGINTTEETYVDIICRVQKVTRDQLFYNSKNRKRELVYARQMHMMVRNKVFNMSLALAGSKYNKDHATVLHAIKTQKGLYETDRYYRTQTADFWERYLSETGSMH